VSILLIRLPDDLAEATARRLLNQGDEVRVLVTRDETPAAYGDLDVHIATGEYLDDADLIERAAQNVRTIVVGGELPEPRSGHAKALTEGARLARVGRIVYCDSEPDAELVEQLRASGLEFVVLAMGKKGFVRRTAAVAATDAAEAIDAADDIADEMHVELDLTQPQAWRALLLPPR
jgi:hypothetical protein